MTGGARSGVREPAATILRVGPASVAWAADGGRTSRQAQLSLLSEPDRQRAAAFAPDRLRRFVVGRLLIHALVADEFPSATGWVVRPGVCRRCGQRHAGAELEGVPARASVSYAPGLVVAAVAPECRACRLGIDIERDVDDRARVEDLRRRLGSSREKALRRWTRVEAVLKADGRGLLIDPGAVWLRRGSGWVAGSPTSYVVAEVDGPHGYLISLAWSHATPAASAGPANRRMAGPAGARWES